MDDDFYIGGPRDYDEQTDAFRFELDGLVERYKEEFDINCSVRGGGLSGQAGAVRHGISKALVLFEPELRKALKSGGFLTRDSRIVERKKYGRRKARRSFQFSKR